jgi:hypothetical protein
MCPTVPSIEAGRKSGGHAAVTRCTYEEDAREPRRRIVRALWCAYCSTDTMRMNSQRALAALALFTICSSPARAEDFEHIRPDAPMLKMAIAAALEGSATFRSIVDRIADSDVIVHMTCGYFRSATMAGKTMLSSAGPEFRYVRVQILCDQSPPVLLAIVAHELQHAAEIASARAVVDDSSFGRLYRKICFPACLSSESNQFETSAAAEAGRRVRAEVRQYSASAAQARQRAAQTNFGANAY